MDTRRKRWPRAALSDLLSLLANPQGIAETWVRVPEEYPTIKEGVAALVPDGGTVFVSGGPYVNTEAIPLDDFNEGAALTIDGDGLVIWENEVITNWPHLKI